MQAVDHSVFPLMQNGSCSPPWGRGTSRRDVMTRIAFAIALVIAGLASVPASAGPGDEQYSAGYQDNAYNRHGW